jgi:large subunit ribosomal protein L35
VPKMKTHKGAAKRFHITGTGKVMAMAHHRNNKRMKKSNEKLYSIRGKVMLDATQTRRVKVLLPGAF